MINITDKTITVVDSIMGSGKTSAMIQKINFERNKNYLFITPYLDEVKRIIEKTDSDFKEPIYKDKNHTKLDDFHDLLASGSNIVTTHSLFLFANDRTEQLILEGDYVLILDESLDVISSYNDDIKLCHNKKMDKDEAQFLINHKLIIIDDQYGVHWIGDHDNKLDMHYSEIKRLADQRKLYCINNKFYWQFASDIFRWFSDIYILTYQFSETVLDAYFQQHGFKYTKVSAESFNDGFRLCDYNDAKDKRQHYAQLINLYNGKYNAIGDKFNAFSINWLKTNCKKPDRLKEIQHTMVNYKNHVKATNQSVMWTTTKQFSISDKIGKQKGFKYTHVLSNDEKRLPQKKQKEFLQFVPCNCRASNDYIDRTVLMYMLNFNISPEFEIYYKAQGLQIDKDKIALNTLLQWIWRSAIRKDKPINLFLPSARMRRLLCEWLCIPVF